MKLQRTDQSKNKYHAPKTWVGMYDLYEGQEVDELMMAHSISFVKERWDCSDFRMVPLIRTLYQLRDRLSPDADRLLVDAVLCFKYWMDEPGEDDMCYTTENHQILFHSSEYLAGQYFKDRVFTNSGMTGAQHQEKARKMILYWLEDRFVHGMSEWHSPVYYEEDIPPICNLIDFAEDEEVVVKSKMVLDLILLDIAMHSYEGAFTVSSGRCYVDHKKHPELTDTAELIEFIWEFGHIKREDFNYERLSAMFYMMKNYEVPEVIRAIGRDRSPVEIKTSMGLDLGELKKEILATRHWEDAGRYYWAMNAFANPEGINLTMRMAHKYNLFNNSFVRELKAFNNGILRNLRLYRVITKILNPFPQGNVLERNNTYTYKTPDYMLSTVQNYHPGTFGAQQHSWSATLNRKVTVFTTSPGTSDPRGKQYWVGNARHPHSVQHKNVNLTLYRLPKKKAFLERELPDFTHAYFPVNLFDKTQIREKGLYGAVGNTYVAVRSGNIIKNNPEDTSDFLQRGKDTYWVTELGTEAEFGDFEAFIKAVSGKSLQYEEGVLQYDRYQLIYKGDFYVDGVPVDLAYPRFDTPYVTAERKSRRYKIRFDGHELALDLDRMERTLK